VPERRPARCAHVRFEAVISCASITRSFRLLAATMTQSYSSVYLSVYPTYLSYLSSCPMYIPKLVAPSLRGRPRLLPCWLHDVPAALGAAAVVTFLTRFCMPRVSRGGCSCFGLGHRFGMIARREEGAGRTSIDKDMPNISQKHVRSSLIAMNDQMDFRFRMA